MLKKLTMAEILTPVVIAGGVGVLPLIDGGRELIGREVMVSCGEVKLSIGVCNVLLIVDVVVLSERQQKQHLLTECKDIFLLTNLLVFDLSICLTKWKLF